MPVPRTERILDAVREACSRIAPVWPLDQFIAVNPWWEMRDRPVQDVAARIALLGHANGHMPRSWFRDQYPQTITRDCLDAAAAEAASGLDAEDLEEWLAGEDHVAHWRNFSDQVDSLRDLERSVSWHDEIVHQISQFCASFYSAGTPLPAEPDRCLFEAWLESVRNDRGIEIMMGERGLHREFEALPDDAGELLAVAVETLGIPEKALEDYFHAAGRPGSPTRAGRRASPAAKTTPCPSFWPYALPGNWSCGATSMPPTPKASNCRPGSGSSSSRACRS